MYTISLSVTAPKSDEQAFQEAADKFVNGLRSVRDLVVEIPTEAVPGTRGYVELLTQIVVTGATAGAFTAIYTLAKDLYDRYATAEVELKFPDGSTLKVKGLTPSQADAKLREHLTKTKGN